MTYIIYVIEKYGLIDYIVFESYINPYRLYCTLWVTEFMNNIM